MATHLLLQQRPCAARRLPSENVWLAGNHPCHSDAVLLLQLRASQSASCVFAAGRSEPCWHITMLTSLQWKSGATSTLAIGSLCQTPGHWQCGANGLHCQPTLRPGTIKRCVLLMRYSCMHGRRSILQQILRQGECVMLLQVDCLLLGWGSLPSTGDAPRSKCTHTSTVVYGLVACWSAVPDNNGSKRWLVYRSLLAAAASQGAADLPPGAEQHHIQLLLSLCMPAHRRCKAAYHKLACASARTPQSARPASSRAVQHFGCTRPRLLVWLAMKQSTAHTG